MEPLVRGVDEESRRKNYSTIKTTPESIVRIYRLQKSSLEPVETSYIFTPKRLRVPWYRKINWDVLTGSVCVTLLAVCIFYIAFRVVIPFVRMIWAY
jgi:hypothetical protein